MSTPTSSSQSKRVIFLPMTRLDRALSYTLHVWIHACHFDQNDTFRSTSVIVGRPIMTYADPIVSCVSNGIFRMAHVMSSRGKYDTLGSKRVILKNDTFRSTPVIVGSADNDTC